MKMKKVLSLLLTLSMVLTGVLFAFPQEAAAEMTHLPLKYKKTVNVIVNKDMGYAVKLGSRAKGAKKITVSTTNKKVTNDLFTEDGEVCFYAKKAGKATVTVKVRKANGKVQKYKFKVVAAKDKSAFKSVKLGKMNLTKKFAKERSITIQPAQKKMKLMVTPAKGWKIKSITYESFFYGDDGSFDHVEKKIKNKSKVVFHKNNNYTEQVIIELAYTVNTAITRDYVFMTER